VRRWLVRAVLLGVVVFVVLQLLPFGAIEDRTPTAEAPWPSEDARSIAVASCYDCHSDEVRLEWFDRVAPASWLVARHVDEGRSKVNFSEWDRRQESDDLVEVVEEGEMPPRSYTLAHPHARLSTDERAALVAALRQLEEAGDDGGSGRGRGRGGRDGEGG
jgi:hypothetical protein